MSCWFLFCYFIRVGFIDVLSVCLSDMVRGCGILSVVVEDYCDFLLFLLRSRIALGRSHIGRDDNFLLIYCRDADADGACGLLLWLLMFSRGRTLPCARYLWAGDRSGERCML